jgi:hypothetical protein
VDVAVAGTQTITVDTDIDLAVTTGTYASTGLTANSSQYAVLLCTGARTAARNINTPKQSKTYVVINDTSGGFAITVRGGPTSPTTGVSVAAGTRAIVAWNGSDFVQITSSVIDLTSEVTGTLPETNGGTGIATTTAYSVVFSGTTATGAFQATAGPGTATHVLTSNGAGALPTFQAPAAAGATKGQAIAFSLIFGL